MAKLSGDNAANRGIIRFKKRPNNVGGPAATDRLLDLHRMLAEGHVFTAVSFARDRELDPRTILRDLDLLRNRGAPIEWDFKNKTYRYAAPFDFTSGLRLDANETLAIILAGRTFAAWGESPLGRALTCALGKVASFAGSAISVPADQLYTALYVPETSDSLLDLEHRHFARLLDLILERREILIDYKKPAEPRSEQRSVRPLHLAYLDHRWILIAEDSVHVGWRNFLLARIESIAATKKRFIPPPSDRIRSYLAGSMGRFTGEKTQVVRLRFEAPLVVYLREKPWHPSQKLNPLESGKVEAVYRLNNLVDVQRRILACGRHVEVVEPPELRSKVADELRAAAAHYEETKSISLSKKKKATMTADVRLSLLS